MKLHWVLIPRKEEKRVSLYYVAKGDLYQCMGALHHKS